jgi:hypothetical protein
MISAYVQEDHRNWDIYLQQFAFAVRSAINETTKVSPALLNLGRELPTPFDRTLQAESDFENELLIEELRNLPEKLGKVIDFVRKNIILAHDKNKTYYDKSHRPISFETGELVLIKNHIQSKKIDAITKKLAPKWIGPYKIDKKLTEVSYNIVTVKENKLLGKRHVSEIKPFVKRMSNLQSPEEQDTFQKIHKNVKEQRNPLNNERLRSLRPRKAINYKD